MINISKIKGAIFDVDETLLSNGHVPGIGGLHEESRLIALQEMGKKLKNSALQNISLEQNFMAFRESLVHSVDGAVWRTLYLCGIVESEILDPNNKILQEIVTRKNVLHEEVLRKHGKEVPGASHFVKALAKKGLKDKMSIASASYRRDINIFLDELTDLRTFFPDERIISKEMVKNAKPHPETFNLAFTKLNLPESFRPQVLAFEDDPRGIESAKAAGLLVCVITTRYPKNELAALKIKPDLIVDSYPELEKIIGLRSLDTH